MLNFNWFKIDHKNSVRNVIKPFELDIYIPSLNIAFEIQGIFHYEPIFGQEKLEQIQKNDLEKIQRCKELGIKLIHIDTRDQNVFTEETSKKYLNLITEAISLSSEEIKV